MGTIIKGLQNILISMGIIAILGIGIVLYYNIKDLSSNKDATTEATTESASTTDTAKGNASKNVAAAVPTTEASPNVASVHKGATTSGANHTHIYVPSIEKDATCTENGIMRYTCSICGDFYTEPIEPTAHVPSDWVTVTAATATSTGLKQKTCKVCGTVLEKETIPKFTSTTGSSSSSSSQSSTDSEADKQAKCKHTFTYEISEEPTCTVAGLKTYTCTKCGYTYTETLPATNHPSRKTITTEATCLTPGTTTTSCTVCGAIISQSTTVIEHDFTKWTVTTAPTTTSTGVKTRTCKVCGYEETKTIDALDD